MTTKQIVEEARKDFSKSAFYMIQKLSIYTDQLAKNFFEIRNVDITHDEFVAINQILNHPDICQRDLAKLILRDRVRTGRILNSLEEKGYITRTNDTKNNRLVRRLRVTKSGKQLYESQFAIMEKVMAKLLEKFSEEQLFDLRDTLVQLEQALSAIVEFNI